MNTAEQKFTELMEFYGNEPTSEEVQKGVPDNLSCFARQAVNDLRDLVALHGEDTEEGFFHTDDVLLLRKTIVALMEAVYQGGFTLRKPVFLVLFDINLDRKARAELKMMQEFKDSGKEFEDEMFAELLSSDPARA